MIINQSQFTVTNSRLVKLLADERISPDESGSSIGMG